MLKEKIIEELQKINNNYGINKGSGVDIERVIQVFNIMFAEKRKEITFVVTKEMIKELNSLRKKLGLEKGNYKEGEKRTILFG